MYSKKIWKNEEVDHQERSQQDFVTAFAKKNYRENCSHLTERNFAKNANPKKIKEDTGEENQFKINALSTK